MGFADRRILIQSACVPGKECAELRVACVIDGKRLVISVTQRQVVSFTYPVIAANDEIPGVVRLTDRQGDLTGFNRHTVCSDRVVYAAAAENRINLVDRIIQEADGVNYRLPAGRRLTGPQRNRVKRGEACRGWNSDDRAGVTSLAKPIALHQAEDESAVFDDGATEVESELVAIKSCRPG